MLPSAELRNDKKGNIDLVVEEKDKGAPEYLEKAPCVFFFPTFVQMPGGLKVTDDARRVWCPLQLANRMDWMGEPANFSRRRQTIKGD